MRWTPVTPSRGSADFDEVPGGSTGRKVLLTVEYDKPCRTHTDLFVKFSRDFDNPIRDRGKTQMEPEVRFASLSRATGFPDRGARPLSSPTTTARPAREY